MSHPWLSVIVKLAKCSQSPFQKLNLSRFFQYYFLQNIDFDVIAIWINTVHVYHAGFIFSFFPALKNKHHFRLQRG